jgi:hypothetical protein
MGTICWRHLRICPAYTPGTYIPLQMVGKAIFMKVIVNRDTQRCKPFNFICSSASRELWTTNVHPWLSMWLWGYNTIVLCHWKSVHLMFYVGNRLTEYVTSMNSGTLKFWKAIAQKGKLIMLDTKWLLGTLAAHCTNGLGSIPSNLCLFIRVTGLLNLYWHWIRVHNKPQGCGA